MNHTGKNPIQKDLSYLWLAFAGFRLVKSPEKSERMEGYLALLHFAAYLLITSAIFRSRAVWTQHFLKP